MTVLQILMLCVLGVGCLVAVGFTIAFIVETLRKPEGEVEQEEVKDEEVTEINLEEMLARLEEASINKEEQKQEIQVEEQEEVAQEQEDVAQEPIEEEIKEEVQVEEKEEVKEEIAEVQESEEPVKEESEVKEEVAPIIIINNITTQETKEEPKEEAPEVIIIEEKATPEFDYRVRLEKIKESQTRIDRDLEKTTRAIMKYERTIRRKDRNQKMLDRRALELTNLNLLMYSVTDIKNVDAEKKARQEELTAHIAELKASIQDAENYLTANKEKHENNLKLRDYLAHEKKRYADEVKELETLIASGKYFDDNADGSDTEGNN